MIQAIRALLQFTTILPLGSPAPFESFARNTWLYPLAGYITGGIASLVFIILPAPPLLQAVLAMGIVILVTGGNHLDGLLDFGDGLMAHGSTEKRIAALTDRQIGTGGVAIGMMITLLSIVSLGSIKGAVLAVSAIILAETGAKWGMAVLTITGKPFHEGLHATFYGYAKSWFFIPATLLLIPAFLLPLPYMARMCAAVVLVLFPLCIRILAVRFFDGVNGDVTGATGEICRSAILAATACCVWV
ncbi:adenosylcobinamide-GDP ribazoletransferase [Methanospirillum stamsii]|uniref:Adenosylcobinamide-GDP ribazoletransferase n=1 Tax=Methanospirillum stamsii TaxID=1277351 RepID=A0A2V2MX03_9EURY|nr:adenosylcobinamide-GDP ribazoletransferase [Methanospirillum stamsii]PWR70760.1 adenosylcobinamide-GDP ribazoletransferase [Methanospirillum stamsii]